MKKVLLFGVFDLFHFGHLRLIERAAKLGDFCIVAVQIDEFVIKFKPPGAVGTLYSTDERVEMIRALRCVDEVITYSVAAEDVKEIEFDVLILGADQNHSGFQAAIKYCKENGKEVITLPRTEGISSTYIRRLTVDLSESEAEKNID